MSSKWRSTARSTIKRAIDDASPELRADIPALFKHVSKAYPFGQRALWPYKIWLDEVKKARHEIERAAGIRARDPIAVKCGACGAGRGRPCRPEGQFADTLMIARDAEEWGRPLDAALLRQQAFHEARRVAVGLAPLNNTLELFKP